MPAAPTMTGSATDPTIWPSVPTDISSPIPRPRAASGRIRWMIVVTATSTT